MNEYIIKTIIQNGWIPIVDGNEESRAQKATYSSALAIHAKLLKS